MTDFLDNDDFFKLKRPLAYRMRPKNLNDFKGQNHIVGDDKVLNKIIKTQKIVNMIFFGPSGSGKTALAKILANEMSLPLSKLNAVSSGVSDLKKIISEAKDFNANYSKSLILLVDEIHHFNRTQQDVLLPYIEDGSIILIGLTTENPYFYVNNAILSRSLIFEFKKLMETDILEILKNALILEFPNESDKICEPQVLELIARICNGDARYALNILETLIDVSLSEFPIRLENAQNFFKGNFRVKLNYDKSSEYHYDLISAFIKSMRGSNPDAAIYWLAVMLDGGEDPRFIARRIAICAAEDVGLAYPNALNIANSAWELVERVGMPEARIILAEACLAVATAPKSNSAYLAIDAALSDVRSRKIKEVPNHLKDASRDKELGHGKNYKYPHDFENHFINQDYFDGDYSTKYYKPSDEGLEKLIKNFLNKLWEKNEQKK